MNESLGYDARALIDQASGGDDPSQADRERMRARLALAMVATTGGFAVAGAVKASSAASGSLVPAASVASVSSVAAVGATVGATGLAAIGTKIAVAVALVSALGGGGALVVSAAHRNAARAESPVAVATVAIAAAPPVAPTVPAAPAVTTASAVASAPVAAPVVNAAAPHPAVSASSASAAASPSTDTPDVADELVLLREARSALKAGNAERSLQILAEHAHRFPHGALTEEREAARAVATCATVASGGSADTARATVARFFRLYPRSLHASRVHNACDDVDAP